MGTIGDGGRYNRPIVRILAPLLLAAGCSYSLRGDLEATRLDIVRLQRAIPPEAPLWIADGPDRFDQFIEDYSDDFPEHVYHHMIRKLHAAAPDGADAAADFDFAACLREPARFRGKPWRVHGVVADLRTEEVDDPRGPLKRIHAGVLFDERMNPVFFRVVQKPDVLTIGEDNVEARAVFVKLLEYETRSGRRVVAPLFIGRALRRYL